MATGDIKILQEQADGSLKETALAPATIGAATATHNHSHNALSGLQGGGSGEYYHLPAGTAASQVPTWNATTGTWDAAAPAAGGTKTYARVTPRDNQPPASAYATLDTRNAVAVLDFDDGATNESAVFVGIIPEGANLASGILVRIFWAATSATTGQCRWGAQWEKTGTDIDTDSFDTATEAHSTTSGTSGIETVTEITCTSIDSLAAGDRFRLKIYRDSSDTTNDTMTGDAELVAVEIRGAA